ncbi:hypothetical protein PUN28_018052 [Cardiocondyla obscurior]|uniref:Uncharacterized protein n=1 Tax=Cardiocondyla obscurior TaxID=286306 RepID=A0AAW2EK28_9HYME
MTLAYAGSLTCRTLVTTRRKQATLRKSRVQIYIINDCSSRFFKLNPIHIHEIHKRCSRVGNARMVNPRARYFPE